MRIVKFVLILVCILSVALICGCAKQMKYQFDKQVFDTPDEALNYMKVFYKENIENRIPPTKTPIGGRVYLIIPTETYYKNIVENPSNTEGSKKYLIGVSLFQDQTFYKEIKARKIFDEIILKTSDAPEKDALAVKDTTVIYRYAPSGFLQNFVRKPSGEPVPIFLDSTLGDKPVESRIDVLNKIEKAAK